MNCVPVASAYTNPEHAALRSNAPICFLIPKLCCTRHAVAGVNISGVNVATIIRSRSCAETFASSSARRAASVASVAVESVGPAIRRSCIPVRCTIQSLVVSTIFSRSAFVSRRSGRADPVPAILAPITTCAFSKKKGSRVQGYGRRVSRCRSGNLFFPTGSLVSKCPRISQTKTLEPLNPVPLYPSPVLLASQLEIRVHLLNHLLRDIKIRMRVNHLPQRDPLLHRLG